jgi:hypothetical protein
VARTYDAVTRRDDNQFHDSVWLVLQVVWSAKCELGGLLHEMW